MLESFLWRPEPARSIVIWVFRVVSRVRFSAFLNGDWESLSISPIISFYLLSVTVSSLWRLIKWLFVVPGWTSVLFFILGKFCVLEYFDSRNVGLLKIMVGVWFKNELFSSILINLETDWLCYCTFSHSFFLLVSLIIFSTLVKS